MIQNKAEKTLIEQPIPQATNLYPLSHNQRRMWYASQLTATAGEYNTCFAARILSPVQSEALHEALTALVERHPILRTTYRAEAETLQQQVHSDLPITFTVTDAVSWDAARLQTQLHKVVHAPFDLAQDSMLRAALFTQKADEHILLLVIPHIAVDTWTWATLLDELRQLYTALVSDTPIQLPAPGKAYSDFVAWQQALLASPRGERMRAYWHQQLGGGLPVLALPTDFPRPALQSYQGASFSFALDEDVVTQLKALGDRSTSLYMALLAAFQVLLSRYSGQEDLLVGTPINNRTSAEFLHCMGDFSDTVVMRADLSGNPTFGDFLAQVRQRVQEALFYADYPFDRLVEELTYSRDPSRAPIYQVLFNMPQVKLPGFQQLVPFFIPFAHAVQVQWGEWVMQPYHIPFLEAPLDLMLEIWQPDGYFGVLKYNTDIFAPATMARMVEHFQSLLAAIALDPTQRITDLPLATDPHDILYGLLPCERTVWVGQQQLRLDLVEAALLENPYVLDCWVTMNPMSAAEPQLNAYIVLRDRLSVTTLQAHLQSTLADRGIPINFLPVSTLALTASGQVDEMKLNELLKKG